MLAWYDAHGVSAIYSHLAAPTTAAHCLMSEFKNARILVVGGAGFVGSNLVNRLLGEEPAAQVYVVDNLLSAEADNVPEDDRVTFKLGSIADDRVLAGLPRDLDYVFHLACYHGNQSSIADPIADHDNNTITTLKLFDRLKDEKRLRAVVYAAAGCAVAEKTFDGARATEETRPSRSITTAPTRSRS